MKRLLPIIALLPAAALLLAAGCNLVGPNKKYDAELEHYKTIAKTVEHADLTTPPSANAYTPEPRTIRQNAVPTEWWDLTVDDAIQLALARSSVLRDLGGTVLRYPENTRTILQPSVVASDPRFGMEAALSEFDATLSSTVTAEKNDRQVNNFIASGGTRFFRQDLVAFQSQLTKVGVAGTQMTLRGTSTYDFNNASFNRFPSVWDTLVDAEIRQPLLQGAGARFNRLAGPNAVPGFYNGVLVARVNTDISVAEFETGIRDLVSNVENAYWDLYFAYRDLDAKIQARNASLEAWQQVAIMIASGQPGGKPEREAQAREQYYRYEEEVQNALSGKLQDATTNNNGSSGGSFRGTGGVLVCERRLRLAMGLPITDGRMLRPADEPTMARVQFDWPSASDDAVSRRPELLRQRLIVKRREMEMVASRNFLLPRFDVLGRYRWRGLGKNLIGDAEVIPDPVGDPDNVFANSSLENLINGDFQEWQLGGEVTLPIGFRRAYAGVRTAQLNLAREKAVLEEQERQIIHDLSNAVGDLDRAYQVMQSTYNRRLAAQQHLEILRRKTRTESISAEQLIDGARRLAEADIQYHRALVEHTLAVKNVHFEKGTLLEYGHVQLAERLSPEALQQPAAGAPAESTLPPPQLPATEQPGTPPPPDPSIAPKAQDPLIPPPPPPPPAALESLGPPLQVTATPTQVVAPPVPTMVSPAPAPAPPASAPQMAFGLPPAPAVPASGPASPVAFPDAVVLARRAAMDGLPRLDGTSTPTSPVPTSSPPQADRWPTPAERRVDLPPPAPATPPVERSILRQQPVGLPPMAQPAAAPFVPEGLPVLPRRSAQGTVPVQGAAPQPQAPQLQPSRIETVAPSTSHIERTIFRDSEQTAAIAQASIVRPQLPPSAPTYQYLPAPSPPTIQPLPGMPATTVQALPPVEPHLVPRVTRLPAP